MSKRENVYSAEEVLRRNNYSRHVSFFLKAQRNKTDKKTSPKSAIDTSIKRNKELLGNANKNIWSLLLLGKRFNYSIEVILMYCTDLAIGGNAKISTDLCNNLRSAMLNTLTFLLPFYRNHFRHFYFSHCKRDTPGMGFKMASHIVLPRLDKCEIQVVREKFSLSRRRQLKYIFPIIIWPSHIVSQDWRSHTQ